MIFRLLGGVIAGIALTAIEFLGFITGVSMFASLASFICILLLAYILKIYFPLLLSKGGTVLTFSFNAEKEISFYIKGCLDLNFIVKLPS